MRVLFLCHRFLDTQIGGLAEFLHHLPISLKNIGINSIIYTQNEHHTNELSAPMTLPNGISCYSGPFIKPSLFTSKKKLSPLLALCQNQKIDLIHAQGIYRSGYMAMKTCQHANIPYVVTSHSDILTAGSNRMKRGKIKARCRKILKHAEGATHLTPIMAKAAYDIYESSDKSTIIGNGIDLAAWKPYVNSTEKNYVLAIGRLERGKGFHVLIDAIAQLKKQGKKTSLVIAGSGAEEKNLQNQALQLGLNVATTFQENEIPEESVIFTGYIKGNAKMCLMSQAHIILFATQPDLWEEAFPIVQLEIMAAGKSTISSDIPTSRYLQQLGLKTELVTAHDSYAWADKITALLDNPSWRESMSRANLENSTQFDWSMIANQYSETYKKILQPR